MAGFIFGGNTGETAQSLARKRAVAEQMLQQSSQAPRNFGEGLTAIGNALAGRAIERRVDREEGKRRKAAGSEFDAIVASLGVAPTGFNPSAPTPPPVETRPLPPAGFDGSLQPGGSIYEAIESVESGGDPNAVSPVGATGVMQIMPATARDPGFGVANIFDTARAMGRPVPDDSDATLQALLRDEDVNRTFGRAYYDAMVAQNGGDQSLALASYNAGPGAVEKYGGIPPFEETQNYVQKISGMLGQQPAPPVSQGAQQPAQSPMGGLDPRLLQLASNEYLTDPQRAVVNMLLQQQVAQMQPAKPTDDMREYDMARQQGYGGSFFDFQRDIRAAGRSQTSVSVGGPQAPDPMAVAEAKGREKGIEALAKSAVATFDEGRNASQQLAQIDQLEGLLAQTETGTIPAWSQWANETLGIQVTGGPAQAASAIISGLIPAQRPPGSGAASDADMRLFRGALPQLVNTSEGNREIIAGMRAIAGYKQQISQIAGDAIANRISYGEMTDKMREADTMLSQTLKARREAMPDMYGTPETPDALRKRLGELGVD